MGITSDKDKPEVSYQSPLWGVGVGGGVVLTITKFVFVCPMLLYACILASVILSLICISTCLTMHS